MPKRAGVNRAAPFTTVVHIPTQAGLEKRLFGELAKGHNCAARSLITLDEQEHFTLLNDAATTYQNALCLIKQAGTVPGYIAQSLQQLRTFLEINDQESRQRVLSRGETYQASSDSPETGCIGIHCPFNWLG